MFKKIFAIIMALLVVSPALAIEETGSHKLTSFKERLVLAFTFDETKKAEKMLNFANRRIEKLAVVEDPNLKSSVLEEYKNYVDNVEIVAKKNNDVSLQERLAESKRVHIEVLENVYDDSSEKERYKIEKILTENLEDIRESSVPLSAEDVRRVETITNKRESAQRLEIGSIGKEISEDRSEEGSMCIQVIQPAKKDGECKEFATPCAVPRGWTPVPSCDGVGSVSSVNSVNNPVSSVLPNKPLTSGLGNNRVDGGMVSVPSTTLPI